VDSILDLIAAGRCRRYLSTQEALPAIDRTALRRLKRHRGVPTALGTTGRGFGLGKARCRRALTLGLAILAAFRLVFEILVVEEVLFSRCKYEIR